MQLLTFGLKISQVLDLVIVWNDAFAVPFKSQPNLLIFLTSRCIFAEINLHLFLSLPPVNLARECGASTRWWEEFLPKSKTLYKAPFADQHTGLVSPLPTPPCPVSACESYQVWHFPFLFSLFPSHLASSPQHLPSLQQAGRLINI